MALLNEHESVRDIVVAHIEKEDRVVSIHRQCELLGISRGSVYYEPHPLTEEDHMLMRLLDEVYTKHPYYGARRMALDLSELAHMHVGRKRAGSFMEVMGIEALYQKKNLSKNTADHARYPYLLRGVKASHANHIWGTDITYIRMREGFVYLVAFLDWFSRYIVSWNISISLDVSFVTEAAKRAQVIGIPDIANSDQGVQFTSAEYIAVWDTEKTHISMDGRGRAMDNIFTERLWRTIKYEEVYLKDYATVREAKENIGAYIEFYNNRRRHQSLGYKTPAEIYYGGR